MYRDEVPLYGDLVEIVNSVDASVLATRNKNLGDLPVRHQIERHGAIRLGTAYEMRMISRLFALLGMHPVGYYDLKMVGFPLHGTAFRPTCEESLRRNPFRVFTTVLRPDLISSASVRETATKILANRRLFSPRLCDLIDKAEESKEELTERDAEELITESLKIFKWHSRATVSLQTYLNLKREHPMVADIVCFPSAHINHLTPRTLDIDAVQAEMVRQGMPAKECIEGPPRGRKCEILLRQTSFKALEERVAFVDPDRPAYSVVNGTHTARFGEVEQRGAAVTKKGRELYDRLLTSAVEATEEAAKLGFDNVLAEAFREYPDDWTELRRRELVYFRYRVPDRLSTSDRQAKLDSISAKSGILHLEQLLESGFVECEPITYEDFLPLSAAGIFESNLGSGSENTERKLQKTKQGSRRELEGVLGRTIPSEIDMYDRLQASSIRECEEKLGLERILLKA